MADSEPETNAPQLVISTAIMVGVSLVFMLLRFGCKARYGKKWAADDLILAFSWVCLAVYIGVILSATRYGLGTHIETISHDDQVKVHKLLGTADFFAIISIAIAKSSFVVTLLHLVEERWHKIFLWFILVTVNLFLWLAAIFIFTSCTPIARVWDFTAQGTCWDGRKLLTFDIVGAAWSAAADFILALFPWVLLWRLNMRKIEKVGICIAMSFGILSGVTAVFKTINIEQSAKWRDWTWLSTPVLCWAAAETSVVIIAASIPYLRLFLKEVTNSTSGGSGSRGYRLEYIENSKGGGSTSHSKNPTFVEARAKRMEDGSDKSILGDATSGETGGVTKSRDARINHVDEMDVESQTWRRY